MDADRVEELVENPFGMTPEEAAEFIAAMQMDETIFDLGAEVIDGARQARTVLDLIGHTYREAEHSTPADASALLATVNDEYGNALGEVREDVLKAALGAAESLWKTVEQLERGIRLGFAMDCARRLIAEKQALHV